MRLGLVWEPNSPPKRSRLAQFLPVTVFHGCEMSVSGKLTYTHVRPKDCLYRGQPFTEYKLGSVAC
jgi:hypothetical protein